MKYGLRLLTTVLSLFALLSSCKSLPKAVDRPNILISAQGTIQLKREGWSTYTPVDFGTILQYDDLLKVEGGTVQILCGDLSLRPLSSGRSSCPCPPGPRQLDVGSVQRRGLSSDVPYIQYPRNTLVLDAHPLLRWHDSGASSYTVAVVQGGQAIWQRTDVTENSIAYPASAPALKPGIDYLLVVRDNDSKVESGADPAKGIGFRVIAHEQQSALQTHCDPAKTPTSLDTPARDYALALCYATWEAEAGSRGVEGEAWLLLESVAQTHATPAVYLWMGDLLMEMTSPDDAEAAYRVALERAEALGDVESQAAACAGVWLVTGDSAYQDQAIVLYAELGDEPAAAALR